MSPSELLLGRRPRTRLDLLKPHTTERVESKQLQQKTKHDATAKFRVVCVGDTVFVKNFSGGNRWLAGKVIKKTGLVSFYTRLDDGRYRRCHQDQLILRVTDEGPEMSVRRKLNQYLSKVLLPS